MYGGSGRSSATKVDLRKWAQLGNTSEKYFVFRALLKSSVLSQGCHSEKLILFSVRLNISFVRITEPKANHDDDGAFLLGKAEFRGREGVAQFYYLICITSK